MTFSVFWERTGMILFTSVAILASAASCSLPFSSQPDTTAYGILKFDPNASANRFGTINAVAGINGQTDPRGLSSVSVQKVIPTASQKVYAFSKNRGVFYSENGGKNWNRRYIFALASKAQNQQDQTNEINQLLEKNNAFEVSDLIVNPDNNDIIYVAGMADSIGKIYQSNDSGKSFKEVYSGVEKNKRITQIILHPKRNLEIYALLSEQDVIRSSDAGQTWGKVSTFEGNPVFLGFTADSQKFFVVRKSNLPIISDDGGNNWQEISLSKTVENANKTGFGFSNNTNFYRYWRMISLPNTQDNGWIVLADNQIWFKEQAKDLLTKMELPLEGDEYSILDFDADYSKGINKVYLSINNSLFSSENKGKTWNIDERVRLSTDIGYINSIAIDPSNPNSLYLGLVTSSKNSFFGGN